MEMGKGVDGFMESFRALVVSQTEDSFEVRVEQLTVSDLPPGDVLIRVLYSSINYKDGLACSEHGKIVNSYPFVPGIDLAGVVVFSSDSRFKENEQVLVTGFDLGVSHYGGFGELARVPADWVVPIPQGLTAKEAMILGTAGFTAALSIQRLEEHEVNPERGPILVTGATGGVGSVAVSMLAKRGYHVTASTGKVSEYDYLRKLGATEILSREEVSPEKIRPLDKQRWAGVVDPVGGNTLAYALSTTRYGGAVAVSGLTAGTSLSTTVLPFILRGVQLIGIDSVYYPMEKRVSLWERIATDLKPELLSEMLYEEVSLEQIPQKTKEILQGSIRGRTLVKL
ncbi:MAG: quinone oxidoreductase, YhdH/YhfP family [Brevibacillus sp.]|nr:quinone oxidoreductase, YhdH/YhfP family [Brevibacillus sp.]